MKAVQQGIDSPLHDDTLMMMMAWPTVHMMSIVIPPLFHSVPCFGS